MDVRARRQLEIALGVLYDFIGGASSWILHVAFIIVIANLWGRTLKKWRGVSRRTFGTVLAGIGTILVSVLLVGYGNSLGAP
jgi:L-rhamnose-H+ transport protein